MEAEMIDLKSTVLGIELGSTRIKAVLIDSCHNPVASGAYEWENKLADCVWTYSLEAAHEGLVACFTDLKNDLRERSGQELETVGAIGVSAMMHGYLPFDRDGNQLTEYRTWRNTMTEEAAEKLTELFGFNIPQRWSIAHLYQACLNGEKHIRKIAHLTTLAGYVHWRLTGEKVIGAGEASGMFPINSTTLDYNEDMMLKFKSLTGIDLRLILPKVLPAGAGAGILTQEGALFLDPSGVLKPGIPVAPCEGDAGTGMTATNSVRVGTGNVSAGTSDFAMIVTDRTLGVHREIDMVTTPEGLPVAMVHCNNCTSDINTWVNLFLEFGELIGAAVDRNEVFTKLFVKALEGDSDCGGLLSYNYFSGEAITGMNQGRPVFIRKADAEFDLSNFMRTHLFSALATLKIGLDILTKTEGVDIIKLHGHGGFFKTPEAGQRMLSAAAGVPVSVLDTAGEGGPYGMALLAAYMLWKSDNETLADYLDNRVFAGTTEQTLMADDKDIAGFNDFLSRYKKAFVLEKIATEVF